MHCTEMASPRLMLLGWPWLPLTNTVNGWFGKAPRQSDFGHVFSDSHSRGLKRFMHVRKSADMLTLLNAKYLYSYKDPFDTKIINMLLYIFRSMTHTIWHLLWDCSFFLSGPQLDVWISSSKTFAVWISNHIFLHKAPWSRCWCKEVQI